MKTKSYKKENRDLVFLVFLLVTAPFWYTDNGGDQIDTSIWIGLYLIIFVAGFPFALGHFLIRVYRYYKYTKPEDEDLEPIRFLAAVAIGWLTVIIGVFVWWFCQF